MLNQASDRRFPVRIRKPTLKLDLQIFCYGFVYCQNYEIIKSQSIVKDLLLELQSLFQFLFLFAFVFSPIFLSSFELKGTSLVFVHFCQKNIVEHSGINGCLNHIFMYSSVENTTKNNFITTIYCLRWFYLSYNVEGRASFELVVQLGILLSLARGQLILN